MNYINLGQIATITNGKRNAQDATENGAYPLFDRSSVIKRSNKYLYDKEAILVPGEGRTFIPKYYKGKFDLHQRCYAIFDLNQEYDVRFIYLYILWNQAYFQSVYTGSTVPSLRLGNFEKMPIPVYSLPEQQKIAAELDAIQSAIDNKKQQLSLLDEAVKSEFVEMFGENPVESGKWKVEKLNDISDVRDGTHDSPSYYSEGYPFITTKNLVDGKIDYSTASLICKEDYEYFDKRSHVDDGDILMPMIGTIGGAVLVKKQCDFAIKNVSLIKHRIENLNFSYLLYVLNSDFMNTYFEQFKIGGTQKFLSLGFIRNLQIPVPPLTLQNQFAAFVQKIDTTKTIIKTQLKDLNELLESKMDFYFME